MMLDQGRALREMPRERLEELTCRALIDLHNLKRESKLNGLFFAVSTGFLIGASVAAGGFIIGTLLP